MVGPTHLSAGRSRRKASPARRIGLALVMVILVPSLLTAADDLLPKWVIEKAEWSGELEARQTVQIRNDFGDIRVRPSEDGRVNVSAAIQRHADDPRSAEIAHREDGAVFEIEVTFAPVEPRQGVIEADSWQRRRIDVTLFLPREAMLVASTERGLIEVKGAESRVDARTQWGDVVLSTGGPVTAYSERGRIDAHFRGTAWPVASRLETLTGSITVFVPAESNVSVEMETTGQLTTDFTLKVAHRPETALKTGRATLGDGTARLYLRSDRGNLSLRRSAR